MNLIAAVIFIGDVHNNGDFRASYLQETSEAACKMFRTYYEKGFHEFRPVCMALLKRKLPEESCKCEMDGH